MGILCTNLGTSVNLILRLNTFFEKEKRPHCKPTELLWLINNQQTGPLKGHLSMSLLFYWYARWLQNRGKMLILWGAPLDASLRIFVTFSSRSPQPLTLLVTTWATSSITPQTSTSHFSSSPAQLLPLTWYSLIFTVPHSSSIINSKL